MFYCVPVAMRRRVCAGRYVAFALGQILKEAYRTKSENRKARSRNANRKPQIGRRRSRINRDVTAERRKFSEKNREATTSTVRQRRRGRRDAKTETWETWSQWILWQKQMHKTHELLFVSFVSFCFELFLISLPKIENHRFYKIENVIFGTDLQMYFQNGEGCFED